MQNAQTGAGEFVENAAIASAARRGNSVNLSVHRKQIAGTGTIIPSEGMERGSSTIPQLQDTTEILFSAGSIGEDDALAGGDREAGEVAFDAANALGTGGEGEGREGKKGNKKNRT